MTRYVMVPVPEEHEDEFVKELLAITMRAAVKAWDEPAVRAVLDALEPADVVAVKAMAAPPRPVDRLDAEGLAAATGVEPAEVPGMIDRINAACVAQSRGYLALTAPSSRPGAKDVHVYFVPEGVRAVLGRLG